MVRSSEGDAPLVETYRALFRDAELIALAPIVVSVLDLAAQVGAELGLKAVDAIHVASAMSAGCDALLTNDKGMGRLDVSRSVIFLNGGESHNQPPLPRLLGAGAEADADN